jgi:hypothetical protein
MKKLLIPLVMALVGIGGGVGAGMFLAPAPHDEAAIETCVPPEVDDGHDVAAPPPEPGGTETATREYARLNNQFVVPVVKDGKVSALVVLSLSIEVVTGATDEVFKAEPKLRDSFLQVLFEHANLGGFDGNFTSAENMRTLRDALRRAATADMGSRITDVLIIDVVRQDV